MSYISEFTCLYKLYEAEVERDKNKIRYKYVLLNRIENILASEDSDAKKEEALQALPDVHEIEKWFERKLCACVRYQEQLDDKTQINQVIAILSNTGTLIQEKYDAYVAKAKDFAPVVDAASQWFEIEISRRLALCREYKSIPGMDDMGLLNLINALIGEKVYGTPSSDTCNALWLKIERLDKEKKSSNLFRENPTVFPRIYNKRAFSTQIKRGEKFEPKDEYDCIGPLAPDQDEPFEEKKMVDSINSLKAKLPDYKLYNDTQKQGIIAQIKVAIATWSSLTIAGSSELVGSFLGELRAELPIDAQGGVFEAMISACPTMADTLKDTFTIQPKVGVDFYLLHLAYKRKQFTELKVTDAASKAETLHGALSDIINGINYRNIDAEAEAAGDRWSAAIIEAASLREFRGCLAIFERLLAFFSFGYYQSESGKLLTQLNKSSIAQFFESAKTASQTPHEKDDSPGVFL